ncbi:MAG: alpha/beta hydrolase family protein [Gemmatimonadales bacterium]
MMRRLGLVLLLTFGVPAAVCAQGGWAVRLPAPTGPFAVGRVTYHWIDSTRAEVSSSGPKARREITLNVWYPALRTIRVTTGAAYIPEFSVIRHAVGDSELREVFRPAWPAVLGAGLPVIDAIDGAEMPPSARFPVLLFSHGLEEEGALYSAELEDLASHGYVVAAIDHPYDAGFAVLSDGRVVPYATAAWSAAEQGGYLPYVRGRVEVWAADTRFVLDRLTQYDAKPALAPFAGHLDLAHVGAFGHSMGGLVSGRVCQSDPRVRACLDQDSDISGSPFAVDRPVTQPFLFIVAQGSNLTRPATLHPSDQQLALWKVTRPEYDRELAAAAERQRAALEQLPAGGWRVTINTPSFIHRSFSDLPLIAATGDSLLDRDAAHNFRVAQWYTRGFFDRYVKGDSTVKLDDPPPEAKDPNVTVERFGPPN